MPVTDLMVRLINLPRPLQRTIAGAIVLVALTVAISLTFLFVSTFARQRETILEGRQILGRMDYIVASDEGHLSSGPLAPVVESTEFLTGSNDALIQAGLQSKLNAVASAAGASVVSSGAFGPVEKNGLTHLGVRANLEGSIDAIYNALLQIEMTKPYLTVDELTIRGPVSVSGLQNDVILSAQMTFSGVRSPEGDRQ